VVLKGGVITGLGTILRRKGAKKTMRIRGAKQQKWGENAQPLINQSVIFSSLKQFIR